MPSTPFTLPRIQGRDVQADVQRLARDLRQTVITAPPRRPLHRVPYVPLVVSDLRDRLERQPLRPDRVRMPLFEIASNPTISLAEVRSRRFGLIDRPPMPASVLRLLAAITKAKVRPEPYGPIRRRSRYEILAAA